MPFSPIVRMNEGLIERKNGTRVGKGEKCCISKLVTEKEKINKNKVLTKGGNLLVLE